MLQVDGVKYYFQPRMSYDLHLNKQQILFKVTQISSGGGSG